MLQNDMENGHSKIIAELSLKQFNSLPKTGKPRENEWTILSCIIKEQEETFEVVSLGTGSKCIGKSKMCPNGTVINDSHAEIVCRRAFLRYLDNQLSNDSIVFLYNEQKRKFVLKPNVKFHFFTTRVPCGDAAIFPKDQEEELCDIVKSDEEFYITPIKKIKVDDIYRTGAKCLKEDTVQDLKEKGAAYHVNGVVRTKPGRGDPTSSVSCSDKLAKWCHLGVQGALLMTFLETPVYLNSFTILRESSFCQKALQRALFDRLSNVQLKKPYGQNRLEIYVEDLKFQFRKEDGKVPCSSSIAWFKSDTNQLEVVAVNGRKQGVTKKHLLSEKSKLKICKAELFKLFIYKVKEFGIVLNVDKKIEDLSYRTAKNLNKQYQENWEILKKEFGVWPSKDTSLLKFVATGQTGGQCVI